MMKHPMIFVAWLGLGIPLHAHDCGVHGAVFRIVERSLLDVLQERLHNAQRSGRLDQLQNQIRNKIVSHVQNPEPVGHIITTVKPRQFLHDPSLVIEEDIKDHQGHIIAPKGKVVNPLDYINWGKPLLFIKGSDQRQVTLTSQYIEAKIVLVDGKPFALEEQLQRPIYYDQAGLLCKRFKIRQVPCLITQSGKSLQVSEFKAPGEE